MPVEEVTIWTRLAGVREFLAGTTAESDAMLRLGASTEEAGLAMVKTSERGWLMNQALFTMRRLVYGVTLATIASGVAAVKWGFDFNSQMQQAAVILGPVGAEIGGVQERLNSLFNFTKHTPFQFKDVTIAFRQMYIGMRTLGISADTVQTTLASIIDGLAAAGRTSPGALNRVSVALQHMAYQGHLTGQAVNQLNRDGIPATAILAKEFGLTGDQIHNVAKLGIPTLTFLKAMNHFMETTPPIAGAAYRLSVKSFAGLFTTFKDDVSQLMGAVESGFFHRLQGDIVQMNAWFDRVHTRIQAGDGSTASIISAIDPSILPLWNRAVGLLHEFWVNFGNIVEAIVKSKALWVSLYLALSVLQGILFLIVPLTQKFGWFLNILIPLIVIWWGATKLAAFWNSMLALETALAKDGIAGLTFFQFLAAIATGKFAIATKLAAFWEAIATGATWLYVTATGALADAFTAEGIAAGIAWAITLGPIVIIIAAILGLVAIMVVLYFKWKLFHNLVNDTWNWIKGHQHDIAIALSVAFAPLLAAYETLKHIYSIWHSLQNAWHWLFGGGNNTASPLQTGDLPNTYHGAMPQYPLFGQPLSSGFPKTKTQATRKGGNVLESWQQMQDNRPRTTHVKVMIGRKTLADVVAEEISAQQART